MQLRFLLGSLLLLIILLAGIWNDLNRWPTHSFTLHVKSPHLIDRARLKEKIQALTTFGTWPDLLAIQTVLADFFPSNARIWLRRGRLNQLFLYVNWEKPWALWNNKKVVDRLGRMVDRAALDKPLYQLFGTDIASLTHQAHLYIDLLAKYKGLELTGLRIENNQHALTINHHISIIIASHFTPHRLIVFLDDAVSRRWESKHYQVYLNYEGAVAVGLNQ